MRANGGGGDLRGGSSPDLLPMAAYKPPPQMHGILPSFFGQFVPRSALAHVICGSTDNFAYINRVFRVPIQPLQPAKPSPRTSTPANRECRRADEPDGVRGQQCCCRGEQSHIIQLCTGVVRILSARLTAKCGTWWHESTLAHLWTIRHLVCDLNNAVRVGTLRECCAKDSSTNDKRVARCDRRMHLQHHGGRTSVCGHKLASVFNRAPDYCH